MGGHAKRPDVLATMTQLMAIPATELSAALEEAADIVATALGCEKVDAFLYEPDKDSLVALGASDTPLARKQRALGLDRMPLTNGGKVVEVFVTGEPYISTDSTRSDGELRGVVEALAVRSHICVPLEVDKTRRGAISAVSREPSFFSATSLDFLTVAAGWIGALVHRAELVQMIGARAAEEGRRAAADDLLTVLAHDLGNYLAPLRARTYLLRQRALREKRGQDLTDAEAAERIVDRLFRMTSELLDIARLDHGMFAIESVPLDLVALVREVAMNLGGSSDRILLHGPAEIVIFGDEGRLRHAIENVVANALKHSPSGVTIHLGTDALALGVPPTQVAVVEINDEGPGIPPAEIERMFQRFVTGSGSNGIGLGLYLARGIAQAHGGTLTVRSTPGKGASFRFTLPVERVGTLRLPSTQAKEGSRLRKQKPAKRTAAARKKKAVRR
ncbi:MAG: Chemotaxis regulator - transmits chemoreceptor signals to flagelllar motor component CheY [Myxococcaceae bacterium]|jgi:two-component system OmpR family sensor kinase|nr:Chemotaxis regulator - transmits chemoreceptor signals to flagelllar motor component CheY [Myxococcaceae bacterium]